MKHDELSKRVRTWLEDEGHQTVETHVMKFAVVIKDILEN